MQLKQIDKTRYRKHLNRVIVACIAVFVIGSLSISQSLIAIFPDPDGSHFHWNLLGVVLTGLAIGMVLNGYRQHPYMYEVVYVWELKQTLNRINRKLTKLKHAAAEGDAQAMQAVHFSYAGSRQLWQLDDNTIVMDELAIHQAELDALAEKFQVQLHADEFDPQILDQY